MILVFTGLFTTAQNRLEDNFTSSAEIYKNLQSLGFFGRVLYVAAHPDDENTRLISHLSNKVLANTAYLSLTRGDGGQNLIGPELREKLGVIRTQELLEARAIDGGRQFFTRANDFGYSKNPMETLEIWNEEAVLADMVKVIRMFRPDVIINRFDHRTPGSTHGHHTASAMLSLEAMKLAADPEYKAHENLTSWNVKRSFFNTSWWFYGSRDAFAKADKTNLMSVDIGSYDPLTGMSSNEIAALSRSQHKSQGFGSRGSRGSQKEWLELLHGDMPEGKEDIFAGIDTSWKQIPGGGPVHAKWKQIIDEFSFSRPSASIPDLLELRQQIELLHSFPEKAKKLDSLNKIIMDCLGIYVELSANMPYGVQGGIVPATLEVINRSNRKIQLFSEELGIDKTLNENIDFKKEVDIPLDVEPSQPYWLELPAELGMYQVEDKSMIGKPENAPAISRELGFKLNDQMIKVHIPLIFSTSDRVKGEIKEPFYVRPPVSIEPVQDIMIFSEEAQEIKYMIKAFTPLGEVAIDLNIPKGWKVDRPKLNLDSLRPDVPREVKFEVAPPQGQSVARFTPTVTTNGKKYNQHIMDIAYDHIPDQQLIEPASVSAIKPGLINKAKRIAYLTGAGDAVPQALRSMGSAVEEYQPEQFPENLDKYDAVVVGIRAFNVHTGMKPLVKQLVQFAQNGGTVIFQYNTSYGLKSMGLKEMGISLSRKRVTDENAKINFLDPGHQVLNFPNKITPKDFDGWVQERGLYFPAEWEDFQPVLEMADKGEQPLKGSLLVKQLGEGYIVYTGLSFFRELPAGVPGAYRLMANLISLSHGKG